MKNLLTLTAALSSFTWAVAYFLYHEKGFIHIFLGMAVLAVLARIIQESYYMRRMLAKRALVSAVK